MDNNYYEELKRVHKEATKALKEQESKDHPWGEYLEDDLEQEIVEIVDKIIRENDWGIEAHDTHRWVETDGFYEVEFHLYTENDGQVFIQNKSGGRDLEEEWSDSNPQRVNSISDCYLMRTWDWKCFLDSFVKEVDVMLKNNIIELND